MIHENLFQNYRQRFDHVQLGRINPAIRDRVLLQDLPEGERIGKIWLPEICQDQSTLRWAMVVAVGPGDTGIERPLDDYTTYQHDGTPKLRIRPTVHGHLPMSVKRGQKVLYIRRQDQEIVIDGETFVLCFEEQAILGIWSSIDGLRPLRDRILVNRDAVEQKTPGGLYIPPSSVEERSEGRVVAKGPGTLQPDSTWRPLEVKKGDHIVFMKGAGSDCKIEGQRYLILRERDVLGVIE